MNLFRRILAGLGPWCTWDVARRLLVGIAVLSASAAAIAEVVAALPLNIVGGFDGPVMLAVEASRAEWFDPVIIFLTRIASYEFMALLFGVLVLWAGLHHGRWDAIVVPFVAAGGAFTVSVIVKTLVWRARPDVLVHPLADVFGPSFPSGHAMRGVALYTAFAWLLTQRARLRAKVAAFAGAALLACIAAYGRVYLGAHWPTDVLAGGLISATWTVYCIRVLDRYGRFAPIDE